MKKHRDQKTTYQLYSGVLIDCKVAGLLALASLITLSSCSEPPPYIPPKAGEVVTWKHSSELIIKTKLGQRREHIPDIYCDRCEAKYEPEYDQYIGQFPIDYVPERFPKMTQAELDAFLTEYDSKLHAVKSQHPIQFSLMLNGAKGKATDDYNNDNENQVKVEVLGLTIDMRKDNTTTKGSFDRMVASQDRKYFIPETLFHKYGLTCYYSDPKGTHFHCFGNLNKEDVTGVYLLVPTEKAGFTENSYERLISAHYHGPIMGGVLIKWKTHYKNWDKWQEIDAAIWRLLNAWNVAPQSNETH